MSDHSLDQAARVAADLSFDSVMITDTTHKILYVNDAFVNLTGHQRADVLGQSPGILQGEATDPAVIDQLTADLKAEARFEGRAINYAADGAPFVMHWRVAPATDDTGAVTHYVAVQRVLSQ